MATRMSSTKTLRPKTLNRGATDDRTRILAYLKRRKATVAARFFGFGRAETEPIKQELAEDIAWIENISERASKRKGGLGK